MEREPYQMFPLMSGYEIAVIHNFAGLLRNELFDRMLKFKNQGLNVYIDLFHDY